MPQALQVIAAVPVSATPPGAANPANSMDSSGDSDPFDSALSAALDRGDPGVTTDSAAETSAVDVPPASDILATGGNPLPPTLPLTLPPTLPPPAAETTPEQVAAVVLQALAVQSGADTTATMPDGKTADARSPALPMLATRPPAGEAAVLHAQKAVPEDILASLRAAPASGETAATPAMLLPSQTQLTARAGSGSEQLKQTVIENMSRLGSATEAAGANNAPAPITIPASGNALLNAPVPASATASFTIPVSFGQAAWGQAMGQQVVWAVNQQMTSADLHLSPPELGPVSVRIQLEADQASISFAAAHGAVREAIEAALPRLRDMLATQGIALTDANVTSQEQFQQAARERGAGSNARAAGEHGVEDQPNEARVVVRNLRLLDIYA